MKFINIPKLPNVRFRRDIWLTSGKVHGWIQRDEPVNNGRTYFVMCDDYDESNPGRLNAFTEPDVDVPGDDWAYFVGSKYPLSGIEYTFEHLSIREDPKPMLKSIPISKAKPRFLEKEIQGSFKRVIQISTKYEAWCLLSQLHSDGIETAFYDGFKKRYRP